MEKRDVFEKDAFGEPEWDTRGTSGAYGIGRHLKHLEMPGRLASYRIVDRGGTTDVELKIRPTGVTESSCEEALT